MTAEDTTGALASALAKAQAAFPPITRDREVTVQMKTGGSYKFKYAPLDTILSAVRGPLSDNGLAIIQLLDEDVLVTSLLHSSGAILSGRTPIPAAEGIQAYGSAITYLRRYAIQALLGIAAEEDDDGNHASGNTATFGGAKTAPRTEVYSAHNPPPPRTSERTFTGKAVKWSMPGLDAELRMDPENVGQYGFVLECEDGKKRHVRVAGDLASAAAVANFIEETVTVTGPYRVEDMTKKDGGTYKAGVIYATQIQTVDYVLPAPESALDAEAQRELDAIAI